MISVKEAAELWGITERRVLALCNEGKIPGAIKESKSWHIPKETKKPEDGRIKSGNYIKKHMEERLPLPIGISDYRLASSEYYYVDKTMMIKEFLDERPMVSLFTRPRRFGKTLNMDMLRTFFEKTQEDTSVYFKDKKVWACGEKYQKHQGKYPVVFLSFKDVKKDTWEETFVHIVQLITNEFRRHFELKDSPAVHDKDYYQEIIDGTYDSRLFDSSLAMLTKMLYEHHGEKPIVIIDEYDTPIQQGYSEGFYDEVILFMRNLFSGCFKDNSNLSYGFLTGILRVAKESIFSGLNNLTSNSVLDQKYSEYFGFTSNEIRDMIAYYHAEDRYREICDWYDGYRFGNTEIFNPWSVINYFRNNCQPGAYWQSTGSNEIVGEILAEANQDIYDKLQALIQGESVTTYIDTGVVYPQVKNNPASVFSFLLVAGYLKTVHTEHAFNGDFMCKVALPNKEITYVYRKEILQKLSYIIPQLSVISIQEAIYTGDVKRLQQKLHDFLIQTVSCYDAAGENFYHGFVLGLCTVLEPYQVTSNKESGLGRYDIQLKPKERHLPGILIELKAKKDCSDTELKRLSQEALSQIREKQYDAELKAAGVTDIIRYGVAFSGKSVEVAME